MKKKKSLLVKICSALLLLGIAYSVFIYCLIVSAYRETPPRNIDTVIVLGARVVEDNPAKPSLALAERLDAAYDYLIENPNSKVIVTGGQGPNEAEPEGVVMGRYLVEKGISKDRVLVEKTSTSTIENIENASQMTDISTAVVVSNDYHIYRAKHIAKSHGVDTVYGLAAPSKNKSTFLSYVREIASLGYHFIFTR